MKQLLQMLYDPVNNFPKTAKASPLGWQPIQSALRLSAKYEFSDLYDHLVEVLKSYWPPTLCEWDEMSTLFRQRYVAEPDRWRPRPNPASIILIAEETHIPSVLPGLYYDVHRMWYINGTLQGTYMASDWGAERLVNHLKRLEASHFLRFATGREYLRVAVRELIVQELPSKLGLCGCGSIVCSSALHQWWQAQTSPVGEGSSDHPIYRDPLGTLEDMKCRLGNLSLEDSMRPTRLVCRTKLQKKIDACRRYLWDEIPYFFNLKPREEGVVYGWKSYLDAVAA